MSIAGSALKDSCDLNSVLTGGAACCCPVVAEEVAHFESLVQKALADSGVAAQDLAAVEISGGAMRMPLLQEALVRVTGFTRALGMKLDDAAVAFGAALLHHRAATETKAK